MNAALICTFLKEIFNYKLIANFTIIQFISFMLLILMLFKSFYKRTLGILLYIFFYFNINRYVMNIAIISTDLVLLKFNVFLLILLITIYYFRKQLILISYRKDSFSNKITDIIYGRLTEEYKIINYYLFLKSCLLFIIDELINFKNLLHEKIKLLLLIIFVFICSSYIGSYESLFIFLLLSYLVQREKEKYKRNAVYKLNFEKNVNNLKKLEQMTSVRVPINNYFLQKANTWIDVAKQAAENPKTIVGVTVISTSLALGIDGYVTELGNSSARAQYSVEYQDWLKRCILIDDHNKQAMLTWQNEIKRTVWNFGTVIPVQPEPLLYPLAPVRPIHNLTGFGTALNGLFGIKK